MEAKEVITIAIRFLRDVLGFGENIPVYLEEIFSPLSKQGENKIWKVTLSYSTDDSSIATLFAGRTKVCKSIEIDEERKEVISLRSKDISNNEI